MIHYFCGTCGLAYFAVTDSSSKTVRADPQCLMRHPLCIQIGTEEKAEFKRYNYSVDKAHGPSTRSIAGVGDERITLPRSGR